MIREIVKDTFFLSQKSDQGNQTGPARDTGPVGYHSCER